LNISLNDSEIKDAIKQYVTKSGIDTFGKTVDITIKTGRRGNGTSAAISITENEDPVDTGPMDADVKSNDVSNEESLFGGEQAEPVE